MSLAPSRRGFLSFLLAAPAIVRASSLMPVKLFELLEPEPLWVSSGLLTPSIIARETLAILESNLIAAKRINPMFAHSFVRLGETLTVRQFSDWYLKPAALDWNPKCN